MIRVALLFLGIASILLISFVIKVWYISLPLLVYLFIKAKKTKYYFKKSEENIDTGQNKLDPKKQVKIKPESVTINEE